MLPADSPFARLPAPGPHPAPAELRAYAAGTLQPAEEHRIEAHTLDCERCADLLTGFSMSDPATTDRAVAELRARLQARVGAEEPAPVAGGWVWPRIAAAAAVLGVVAGGIWTWERHETAPPAATARLKTTATPPPAAPAARPASMPAPTETEAASAPETAVAKAPAAPKAAAKAATKASDYAVVGPTRSRRAAPPVRPGGQAMEALGTDAMALADAAPAPEAQKEARVAAASTIAAVTTATSAVDSVPPKPSALVEMAAPDTLANANAARASRSFASKAKSASSTQLTENTASVRVANTPMPATPAINPAPVGGTPAFRNYLHREADAFEPGEGQLHLHGTVRLRFMVGADGKISNLKVLRSLRKDYDDEALRMVCEGPGWQPGIAGGRRTDLSMELTVTF
ncbi:energy transducer TonB [Microvirga sp. STS02]|uniref:energy transducer TonB n=1 Tax=Hymenobacter negativus TaxID=2795026 RepID=UPI0018DC22E9|nr:MULTISPECIES: energy transducer TonB [Bacteria]MBH8570361.1 energy transducer TonB [Hymenobacter negativus]MBR7210100.1 energy transducer TonB [Microvirga sp. STS02]